MQPIDHAWILLKNIPTRPRVTRFGIGDNTQPQRAGRIPTSAAVTARFGRGRDRGQSAFGEARDARLRESHPHFPLRRREEFSDELDDAGLQHHAANAARKLADEKGLIDTANTESNDDFWDAMLDRYSDYNTEPYIQRIQSTIPPLGRDERELEELGHLTSPTIPARTLPPQEGSDMYNLENQ